MNPDFGLKKDDLQTICGILAQEPAIEQAIIFGSRAKGNYKPGSDVDIALKGKNLSAKITTTISFQLNEETTMPYKFDVLNYHTIKEPALIEHINRVGKVFYEKIHQV
jgi:predicted nucleotidyltransferase